MENHNLDDLIQRCIKAIPQNKKVGLTELHKTKDIFNEFVGENKSDTYYAEKITEFIHGRNKYALGNTHKEPKFVGDNSPFSAHDVSKNINNNATETGDSLGTSQIAAYLLSSKGIKTSLLSFLHHVLLEANIDNKWIPIETSKQDGFNNKVQLKYKIEPVENLEAMVFNSQGYIFNRIREFDSAIENYTKAIEIDSEFESALNNRGIAYFKKGKFDSAIENFTKVIQINPKHEDAFNNRGSAYYEKGEFDSAIENFTEAIKINKKFVRAFNHRGLAYYNKGKFDSAIENYTKAIRIDSKYEDAFFNRGLAYYNKEKFDSAIENFTEAIKINKFLEKAFGGRGNAYYKKGKLKLAIKDYKKYASFGVKNKSEVSEIIKLLKKEYKQLYKKNTRINTRQAPTHIFYKTRSIKNIS